MVSEKVPSAATGASATDAPPRTARTAATGLGNVASAARPETTCGDALGAAQAPTIPTETSRMFRIFANDMGICLQVAGRLRAFYVTWVPARRETFPTI